MESSQDIQVMKNLKMIIENENCLEIKNDDYKNIYKMIKTYLQKHCHHNIIKDYIDITTDTSKDIYYCSHCYLMEDEIHIK